MKTPMKLTPGKSLFVEPCTKRGGVIATFAYEMFGIKSSEAMHLTPAQCQELIYELEQASQGDKRTAETMAARAGA